jgi:hypothetical protein
MRERIRHGLLCDMSLTRPRGSPPFDTPSPSLPPLEHASLRRGLDVVLTLLATLPATDEVRGLVEEADQLRREEERWRRDVPSPEARDRAMRHVLAMHVAAAALVSRRV